MSGLRSGRRAPTARERAGFVRVLPGDYHVCGEPDTTIVTVLGSCVAACIRDPESGFGGLNHFMLPESATEDWNGVGAALRYGNFAMEALINAVLKSGCRRSDLEVKLFGGAAMNGVVSDVGRKNAAFARHYLDVEGIPVVASDLGGPYGRRIEYQPFTGKVQRLVLRDHDARTIDSEERRYKDRMKSTVISGDIDLFD